MTEASTPAHRSSSLKALSACLPAAVVGAIAILFQLPFFDLMISSVDEGHQLQFAQIVNEGGVLYRDGTFYPLPGAFWLLALAFRLAGPSILVARWLVVFEFGLFCALVWLLVRPLVSRFGAGVLVLLLLLYRVWAFPHWQIYSYSTTALLVQIAMLLALLRFFHSSDRRWLALAGFLFGFGVLCKQDYGAAFLVAAVISSAVYFVRVRTSPAPLLGWFLGPPVLVALMLGLYFWTHGILSDVVQLTVLGHIGGILGTEYWKFPSLLPFFSQDPALRDVRGVFAYMPSIVFTADWNVFSENSLYRNTFLYDVVLKIFYFCPILFYGFGALRLCVRSARISGPGDDAYLRETVLWATGTALLVLVWLNRPQDYVHLAVLLWPLPCLSVIYADDFVRGRWRRGVALGLALLLPASALIAYSARLVVQLRARYDTELPLERAGGIRVTQAEARFLKEIVDYVHEHSASEEPVAVLPYFPLLHFLSARRAPDASSYVVWPIPDYPDREQRIIRSMEKLGTRVVLYDFSQIPMVPPAEEYAPDLFRYLVDHFEMDQAFQDEPFGRRLVALRRRPSPEPGVPLLPGGSALPSFRVERPGGETSTQEGPSVARERWPFAPVLALRPIRGGRTVVTFDVDISAGARLQTAVGAHPRVWAAFPPSATRLSIDLVADGVHERLLERSLDPTRHLEDRGWFEVDISLERYAGRRVRLEFAATTDDEEAETLLTAGFEEPRLLLPLTEPRR